MNSPDVRTLPDDKSTKRESVKVRRDWSRLMGPRAKRLGLAAALGSWIALVLIAGTYVVTQLSRQHDQVQDVHRRSIHSINVLSELRQETIGTRHAALDALAADEPTTQAQHVQQSKSAEARAAELLTSLRADHVGGSDVAERIDAFAELWNAFLVTRNEILTSLQSSGARPATAVDFERSNAAFNEADRLLLEIKASMQTHATRQLAETDREAMRSLKQLSATLTLTIVFTAAAIWLVFRYARLAAIRASDRRMLEVVESISEAMVVLDPEQRITLWNQPAEELFGVTKSMALGRSLGQVLPDLPSTTLPVAIEAATRQQKMQVITELRRTVGSSQRIHEARIFPFERGVTMFFSDITKRKQTEERRLGLERKLLESQKLESLGVLSGGVAHDFNNLLTAIMGNASLAALDIPENSETHEYIKQIQQASRQASNLCQQMLAYAGRGRFHVQTTDLNQLVQDLNALLRVSVPKHIDLQLDLGTRVPATTLDTTQIKQVLLNLVINAAEAIGEKNGTITVRTRVWPERTGVATPADDFVLPPSWPAASYAALEVIDDGCGMNKETRAKIFDPFFTTKFTGRGLGLAAVLGIIRGHRGALRLDTAAGKGTKFVCYFPASAKSVEAPPPPSSEPISWKGSGKILLVDDEEQVRSVVANMLRLSGFTPILGHDGQEGVDLFRASPGEFVAVILDITMPRLNGHEALDQMLAIRPDLPAIVISGFSEQEIGARVTARPQTVVMPKPFEVDKLQERLRVLLSTSTKTPFESR